MKRALNIVKSEYLLKLIAVSLLAFLLLSPAYAQTNKSFSLLNLQWDFPASVDDVFFFDLDKDGEHEVYAAKYNQRRSYLYSLTKDGTLNYKTWVDKVGSQEVLQSGGPERLLTEEIMYFYPADLDDNGNLDIIAGSDLKGPAMTHQQIYMFERAKSAAGIYTNDFKWKHMMGGIPTKVKELNNRLVVSSVDSNIYVLGRYGDVRNKYEFDGAVWDFALRKDNSLEGAVVATFNGIYKLQSGSPQLLREVNQRVSLVEIADVNLDGKEEIIAVTKDDTVRVFDEDMQILWSKKISGVVDIHRLDFNSNKYSQVLIFGDRIIYGLNEELKLNTVQALGSPITSASVYPSRGESKQVIVGAGDEMYYFSVNPDFGVYQEADYYLQKARYQYLTLEDCRQAVKYARECQSMFQSIGYQDGALRCYLIIEQCDEELSAENKSKKAEELYNESKSLLEKQKFQSAHSHARMSLDIYISLGSREGSFKADDLLLEIENKWDGKASEYYSLASDSMQKGNFSQAIVYAEESHLMFSNLNDTESETRAASLLARAKSAETAQENLQKARSLAQNHSYANASEYANRSKAEFMRLGYLPRAKEASEIINLTQKFNRGNRLLNESRAHLNKEELSEAKEKAQKAKQLYEEIDYQEKVDEADSVLAEIEEIEAKKRSQENFYIYAAIVLVLMALLGILYAKVIKPGHHRKLIEKIQGSKNEPEEDTDQLKDEIV